MQQSPIKLVSENPEWSGHAAPQDHGMFDSILTQCLSAAHDGNHDACFDLGVIFSTGSHGAQVDLIEAHKWFNLAAVSGHDHATQCRADVAEDMTAREIAEAQRRAREWLRLMTARPIGRNVA